MKTHTITIPFAGMKLSQFLQHEVGKIPTSLLHKLIRKGALRINGKRCKPETILAENDVVKIPDIANMSHAPRKANLTVTSKQLSEFKGWIIFENEELYVLNKPEGLAVQGGTKQQIHIDLFLDALGEENKVRPRIVHRLDKETSGILLIAKTPQSASKIADLFKEKKIQKTYLAIVVGEPESQSGMIDLPLSKEMKGQFERVVTGADDAKEAITSYKVLEQQDGLSLLELKPLTGRTHQLRAHCSYGLQTPILGDGKYGGRDLQYADRSDGLYLHAFSIDAPELSLKIKVNPPEKFFHLVKNLEPYL